MGLTKKQIAEKARQKEIENGKPLSKREVLQNVLDANAKRNKH